MKLLITAKEIATVKEQSDIKVFLEQNRLDDLFCLAANIKNKYENGKFGKDEDLFIRSKINCFISEISSL